MATKSRLVAGPAPERRRQRFLSGLEVGGFVLMVLAVLVSLFPGTGMVPRSVVRPAASDVSKPGSRGPPMTETMAPQGELLAALAKARHMLADPRENVRRQARLIELEILRRQAYVHFPGTPERAAAIRNLIIRLREAATIEFSATQYQYLADLARELDQTSLYVELCRKLAKRDPASASRWFAKAAQAALREGNYRDAAALYFDAQANAKALPEQREYYLLGLRALQSGNLLADALEAARAHLPGLEHDRRTLIFLVKLALAAARPDVAERYVRMLMQQSRRSSATAALMHYLHYRLKTALNLAPSLSDVDRTGLLPGNRPADVVQIAEWVETPFDKEVYELAYRVFLENGHVHDAYGVAAAAVEQVPEDLAWRKRLAQVAQWLNKPEVALEQWVFIARRTGSEANWNEVVRRASALGDSAQLIRAYQALSKLRVLTQQDWDRLVQAYEGEGKPEEVLPLLDRANRATPRRYLAMHIAEINVRLGRVASALMAYREIERRYGVTPDLALAQAALLLDQGNVRAAFDELATAKSHATPQDVSFWELYADTAWQLQEQQQAQAAYELLAQEHKLEKTGWERLTLIYGNDSPEKAIGAAQRGWRTYRDSRFLITEIELLRAQRAWDRLGRLYASLGASDLAEVDNIPYFWISRAEYRGHIGDNTGAVRDYLRALRIEPESIDVRSAVLWLLIDIADRESLARYLRAWQRLSWREQQLWAPYAAGYYTLGVPNRALPYFIKELKRNSTDYLLWLNYADALDQAGYSAMAWRVRRYVWGELRSSAKQAAVDIPWTKLEAITRLALERSSGDSGLLLVQALLRRRAGQGHETPAQAASINELILAWTLSKEEYQAARMWLWLNYARQLTRPGWAELSLALAQNDIEKMEALILNHKALPVHDQIEAEMRSDHLAWARHDAFGALSVNGRDDIAHEQLTASALRLGASLGLGLGQEERGTLDRTPKDVWLILPVSPHFDLEPAYNHIDQSSRDQSQLVNIPATDTQLGLTARFRWLYSSLALTGFHRDAVSDFTGFSVEYTRQLQQRVNTVFRAGRNLTAYDTVPLLVAGVKDELAALVNYDLSKREYLQAELALDNFYSQQRDKLGSGTGLNWEMGHRLRSEYPDLVARIYGTFQRYSRVDEPLPPAVSQILPGGTGDIGIVIPDDFNVYAVGLTFGDSFRDTYTRAWRPYGEAGLLYNTTSGRGYDLGAGVSGSAAGNDRLTFYYTLSRGGTGSDELIRRFGLLYQIFFK